MKSKINKIVLSVLFFSGTLISSAQTATEYFTKGIAEFNYGNNAAAMENMNKAIALKADYANALSYRGYFFNQLKEYDKAMADYVAADKITKNVNGYLIANPFALTGKKDDAFKYLEASLSATEGKPLLSAIMNDAELASLHSDARWQALISKNWYTEYETLINKANDLGATKDANGALEILNKAIELDPKQGQAYSIRAVIYFQAGQFDKALADINQAINANPKKSSYYSDRAYLYKELKRSNDALADYNKAIELDPENMVYGDRAMLKFGINQKDPGVASDLKKHLDSYYKDDFNWFLLGTYHYGMDNFMEAIIYITKAIKINDKTADYYTKRGQAFFGQKQIKNAIADFNMAISLNPKNCQAYYLRGTAKGENLDKVGACEDWKKAQSLGCEDYNGYIRDLCK